MDVRNEIMKTVHWTTPETGWLEKVCCSAKSCKIDKIKIENKFIPAWWSTRRTVLIP